jgi:hypothetical protein
MSDVAHFIIGLRIGKTKGAQITPTSVEEGMMGEEGSRDPTGWGPDGRSTVVLYLSNSIYAVAMSRIVLRRRRVLQLVNRGCLHPNAKEESQNKDGRCSDYHGDF